MNTTKFKIEDIDWKELGGIGISREFLEINGLMEPFLSGEMTIPLNLDIPLLNNDLNVDATLQLTKKGESPIVNIVCVNKEEDVEVEMY